MIKKSEEEKKESHRLATKKWRDNNKGKVSLINKIYKEKNIDKIKNQYEKNKDKNSLRKKKYYVENKEYFYKKHKEYYENNTEKKKYYAKEYRKNNIKKVKEYKELNKDKINEYYRNYIDNRRKEPLYRFSNNIRKSILAAFKKRKYVKKNKTVQILGCSFEEFKSYIESKFESWMNWDNYGKYNGQLNFGWDVDHIIPVSIGMTEEELLKLNHYTNLQPLCSYTNRYVKKDII